MAMSQGKNDINLYWKDKNNKMKNFYFQLFSLFFPLFELVLWYTATPGSACYFYHIRNHTKQNPQKALWSLTTQCANKTVLLYDYYTTSEQGHSG